MWLIPILKEIYLCKGERVKIKDKSHKTKVEEVEEHYTDKEDTQRGTEKGKKGK
jgi:hypothetical protein